MSRLGHTQREQIVLTDLRASFLHFAGQALPWAKVPDVQDPAAPRQAPSPPQASRACMAWLARGLAAGMHLGPVPADKGSRILLCNVQQLESCRLRVTRTLLPTLDGLWAHAEEVSEDFLARIQALSDLSNLFRLHRLRRSRNLSHAQVNRLAALICDSISQRRPHVIVSVYLDFLCHVPSYKPFSSLTIWRRAFRCSGVTSSCFDEYHNVGYTTAWELCRAPFRTHVFPGRYGSGTTTVKIGTPGIPAVIDGEGLTPNTRWSYSRATCGASRACAGYPNSQPSSACLMAWRLTSAMDSVSGMSFGQILTQFCALAQSATPPGPITASSRSRA